MGLKAIYQAPTEEKALEALERVTEKWSEKYPNSMKRDSGIRQLCSDGHGCLFI